MTVGTFSMLMQALQQFAMRIGQVMQSLSGVHEQSLYLSDLYEFLEIDAPRGAEMSSPEAGRLPESPRPLGPQGVPEAGLDRERSIQRALPALRRRRESNSSTSRSRYPGGDRRCSQDVNLLIQPRRADRPHRGKRRWQVHADPPHPGALPADDGADPPRRARYPDHSREELHRYFAAVFQEYARYQFTVADNIRFGRLWDATDADVRRAAQQSGADEFIQSLPEGYGTLLGRPLGGVDLSGGQWQKLAIARALVRQAPVVILDEPTAALDPKAEAEVYRQFGEMTRGRTAILISHRLGSARLADRIVVLKGGRIVETGTHDELLRAGGGVRRLFHPAGAVVPVSAPTPPSSLLVKTWFPIRMRPGRVAPRPRH